MKLLLFAAPLCICLAACAPVSVARPVEVKIPVSVPCVTAVAPEPDWNIAKLSASDDPARKLKAALIDLYLSRIYIKELQAQLAACT